jgi:hypothetical protein
VLAEPRTTRRVGAAVVVLGIVAAAATVWLSGANLWPGFALHVEFERIGNLKSGSKVRMCGREIGEVTAVRLTPARRGQGRAAWAAGEPEEPRLTLDLWLRRAHRASVARNSEFFVGQEGLIGEQHLEIGAPPGDPAPPVEDGMQLRGIDPPRIDRVLGQTHRLLVALTGLLDEARPLGDEILGTARDLSAATAATAAPDPLTIYRRVLEASNEARAAYRTAMQGTNSGADLRALRMSVGELSRRLQGDLHTLGEGIDLIARRLEEARDLWSPERRARLGRALETLRHVVALAHEIARDADAVLARVERGEGTVGGFLHDRELWDDLHATHKLLKDRPWTLILKPSPPKRE